MNPKNLKTNKDTYIGKGCLLSGGNVSEFEAIRNQLRLRKVKWREFIVKTNGIGYDPKQSGRYFVIEPESIKRLPRGSSSSDPVKRPYLPVGFENGHSIYEIYQKNLDFFEAIPATVPERPARTREAMKNLILEAFNLVNNLCIMRDEGYADYALAEHLRELAVKRMKRREREFNRQWS